MSDNNQLAFSRRAVLASGAAIAADAVFHLGRPYKAHAAEPATFRLRAAPGRVRLLPGEYPETPVWCYGIVFPAPKSA